MTGPLFPFFHDAGEARLSAWRREKLLLTWDALEDGGLVPELEKAVIARLEPLLNLVGWGNPQREVIRGLRRRWVEMAAKDVRI